MNIHTFLLTAFLDAGLNGCSVKRCLGLWDFITDPDIKKVHL